MGDQTVSASSFFIDSCPSRQSWLKTGCKGEIDVGDVQSPFSYQTSIATLHWNIVLHLQHQIRQTLLYLSTLTLFPQVTNSQTTFPRPESSHAPTPSLRTTTSKILEETSTELSETTLEFEPTEAFPRLDCGGRGFYQVGWLELVFNISVFS